LHQKPINSGWIEVICGGMFSGKTEELLRRIRRAKIANLSTIIFKPHIDTRYSKNKIVSHNNNSMDSVIIKKTDRRVARDISERGRSIDSVLKQYKKTVYPMHKRFVEPSKSIADINISGENKTEKSVQKIITSIDSLLLKRK